MNRLLILMVAIAFLPAVGGDDRGLDDVAPRVALRAAPMIQFQRAATNTPVHWSDATLYVMNGASPPRRTEGPDILHQSRTGTAASFDSTINGHRWFEATWKDDDGTLYGWYHNEPRGICENANLTAPRVGAARSTDDGITWADLGFVIEAPADSLACDTTNAFYAGGVGDFSVLLDDDKEYFYFFISTFHGDTDEQGIALARMRYADRNHPVGKVWKWRDGNWNEPGLGGHVAAIVAARSDWHGPAADVFWGPSVHWNTHLGRYVMLLNRAQGSQWAPEGFYVAFNDDVADPRGWSTPLKLVAPENAKPLVREREAGPWYIHVVGTDHERRETDKRAGRVARLFIHGESHWEIVFSRSDAEETP